MGKLLTSLSVAAGLIIFIGKASAAISSIGASAIPYNDTGFLLFDGTTLSVSTVSPTYALRFAVFAMMGPAEFALGDYNSGYAGDGFTLASVNPDSAINSGLAYSGNINRLPLPQNSYYGFRYAVGSADTPSYHYGWANFTANGTDLILNAAAINTTAGEPILAGQTTTSAVPEPGAWLPSALLVFGAVIRRRRSRSTAGREID